MGALDGRIASYDEEIEGLQSNINSKSAQADELRAQSKAPKVNTMQDALLSSLVQVLPGVLGYLAAGKEGGAYGLTAGLQGGQAYNKIIDDRAEDTREQAGLQADALDTKLKTLLSQQGKLEGEQRGLENWGTKFSMGEAGRNARNAKSANSNSALMQALGARLSPQEAQNELSDNAGSQASDPTSATGEKSEEEKFIESMPSEFVEKIVELIDSPEGMAMYAQDQQSGNRLLDAANKRLGITKSKQSIEEGEQNIIQSKADTEKAIKEGDLLDDEIASKDRYKIMVEEGLPLPNSKLRLVATDRAVQPGTKESEQKLDDLTAFSAQVDTALGQIMRMQEILENKNAGQRVMTSDAKRLPDQLASTLALVNALERPGNRAPSDADLKAAKATVQSLKIGNFLSNIGEQTSAATFGMFPSFREELDSLTKNILNRYESSAKTDYGYNVEVSKDSMQTNYNRANNNKARVVEGSAADGKRYRVTYDENGKVVNTEEIQ